MTIYKSAADEIAELMAHILEKDAGIPTNWEALKQRIMNAKTCEELKSLSIAVSRCPNPDAEPVFNFKKRQLKCR